MGDPFTSTGPSKVNFIFHQVGKKNEEESRVCVRRLERIRKETLSLSLSQLSPEEKLDGKSGVVVLSTFMYT
jgi:hypothetical protein